MKSLEQYIHQLVDSHLKQLVETICQHYILHKMKILIYVFHNTTYI